MDCCGARFRPGRAVRGLGELRVAPELVVAEICNATWKLAGNGRIADRHGRRAVRTIGRAFDDLFDPAALAEEAFARARALDHPAYDCFYAAFALRQGATLVTCDARFLRALRRSSLAVGVRALNDLN